jgi:hypothetical protein
MSGNRIDGLAALSLPHVGTDRFPVARAGVTYRENQSRMHGGVFTRRAPAKPLTTDFATWVNQGVATLTDNGDALSLEHNATLTTGNNVIARERNLPAGDWDVLIGARRMWTPKEFLLGGLFLRESATGKIELFGHGSGSGFIGMTADKFTSTTVFSANRRQVTDFKQTIYFRARKFGTSFKLWASFDGDLWFDYIETIPLSNFFTTAPDKWGFGIHPVNNGATNATGMRLDVIDWQEDLSRTDVMPDFAVVDNADGRGNRAAHITVTTTATLSSGSIATLVDGAATNGLVFNSGQSGRSITFQFDETKVVKAGLMLQNITIGGAGHGNWKWQGSNDGSAFTDLSAAAVFDGNNTGLAVGDLSANVTAYTYYRLLQTSGTTSSTPNLWEMEFKLKKG